MTAAQRIQEILDRAPSHKPRLVDITRRWRMLGLDPKNARHQGIYHLALLRAAHRRMQGIDDAPTYAQPVSETWGRQTAASGWAT